MINPWKRYSAKPIGKVLSLDQHSVGWFKVQIENQVFEGYLRDGEPNHGKLRVGDSVRCKAEWSITADHWLIREVRKVRAA